jgi:hypothetical protein
MSVSQKFKIGQRVKLSPARLASNRHPNYEVVRLMPTEGGDNHYRVRSVWDGHERIVGEGELS